MMRKTAITIAAVAILTLGSTLAASAHGGMGHMGGMGMGHMGGWGHMGRMGLYGHPFAFHNRFRNRFFFVGAPFAYDDYGYDYGYDDTCHQSAWTRFGWRWIWVCY